MSHEAYRKWREEVQATLREIGEDEEALRRRSSRHLDFGPPPVSQVASLVDGRHLQPDGTWKFLRKNQRRALEFDDAHEMGGYQNKFVTQSRLIAESEASLARARKNWELLQKQPRVLYIFYPKVTVDQLGRRLLTRLPLPEGWAERHEDYYPETTRVLPTIEWDLTNYYVLSLLRGAPAVKVLRFSIQGRQWLDPKALEHVYKWFDEHQSELGESLLWYTMPDAMRFQAAQRGTRENPEIIE